MSRFDGTLRFVPAGFNWDGRLLQQRGFRAVRLHARRRRGRKFELICDTLLANDITPMSLAGQNPFIGLLWFDYLNLRLNGPEFHRDLIAGRVDFYDERIAQVWEFWQSLLGQGLFRRETGQHIGDETA